MFLNKDKSGNVRINQCILCANTLLDNEIFYKNIKVKETPFDMSTASAEYISNIMYLKKNLLTCNVRTYHRRFTRALAYFIPSQPDTVYINTAKLNRSTGSIIATLIHEWVHLVDHDDKTHSFGHGDNSPRGKQNTAPYWIDNLAQSFFNETLDFNNNQSSKIKRQSNCLF